MKKSTILSKLMIATIVALLGFLSFTTVVSAEDTLLFEQVYEADDWTAATGAIDTDNEVDYEPADNIWDLNASIDRLVVKGLSMFNDGVDWIEMTPDSTEPFVVRFYEADIETEPGLEAPSTGTYQICLEDSYGDGWNGAIVSVFVNDVLVLDQLTLDSGAGPECHDFSANAGDIITTVYVPGSYPTEPSYSIVDPDDNVIAEEGTGGTEPTGIGEGTWSEPDWSSPVSEQNIDATVTDSGLMLGDYVLYNYELVLDNVVELSEGWVSLQIDADTGSGTWFLWANSYEGDMLSYQRVPAVVDENPPLKLSSGASPLDVAEYDLAIEIWGDVVTNPVINVDTGEGFDTIQAAIDDVDTLDGHTIEVATGTYPEEVYVNKSLTLLGPNAGVHGTSGSRVDEAIIRMPDGLTGPGGYWGVPVYIDADDVTIDGFTVSDEGSETCDGYDYFTGIAIAYKNNAVVTNNIMDGFNYTSIFAFNSYPADMPIDGIEITDNLIINNFGSYHAIYMQGAGGTISGNTVDDCGGAIQIQPYSQPIGGTVTNNELNGYVNGIYYNYVNNGAGKWFIEENNISPAAAPAKGVWTGSGDDTPLNLSPIEFTVTKAGVNWSGLYLRTFAWSDTGADPEVEFNNNIVDGSGATDSYWDQVRATQIRGVKGNGIGLFYGNDLMNCDVGVFVYDDANVSSVSYHQNNFIGNLAGVDNTHTAVLDATCNWWNDVSGPSGQGSGSGESVSTNVDFTPWLTDLYPVGECNGWPGPVTNIDTEEQFSTIQAAIDDADTLNGHTILANAGTYVEDVNIDKDLTVMGVAATDTIIEGIVTISADGATLTQFTIAPNTVYSGNEAGVTIGSNDVTVEENIIDGVTGDGTGWFTIKGIHVYGGSTQISNILIQNNEIKNIHNQDDGYPTVYGGADGIMVQGNCADVSIIGNTITDVHSAGWAYGMSVTPTNIPPDYPTPQNVVIQENTIDTVNDGSVYTPVYDGVAFSLDETSGGADDGDASQITLEFNNFINTAYGAVNKDTSETLVAECNWWGDITGPYNETTNPTGTGAEIIGDISFLPWLTDLFPEGECTGGLEQLDIEQTVQDRGFPIRHADDGDWAGAQNFTPTLSHVSKVELYLRSFGTPEFDLTVELRLNGPEGTLLDTVTFTPGEISSSWTWLEVDFEDQNVGIGSDVFIVVPPAPSGVTTSFGYEWGYAFGDQYDDGSFWFTRDGGGLWRDLPTMYEFVFKTYGF